MAKKENRRTQETKKNLRNALLAEMQEKPFAQITVKDICAAAGLNRTTFYLHYPNQEALLREIEQTAYVEIEEYIRSIRAREDKKEQIQMLLTYIRKNLPLFRIILFNQDAEYKERFMRHFLETLDEERMRYISSGSGIYTKAFLIHGCIGLVTSWIEDDFGVSTEELAELMYHTCHNAYEAQFQIA